MSSLVISALSSRRRANCESGFVAIVQAVKTSFSVTTLSSVSQRHAFVTVTTTVETGPMNSTAVSRSFTYFTSFHCSATSYVSVAKDRYYPIQSNVNNGRRSSSTPVYPTISHTNLMICILQKLLLGPLLLFLNWSLFYEATANETVFGF